MFPSSRLRRTTRLALVTIVACAIALVGVSAPAVAAPGPAAPAPADVIDVSDPTLSDEPQLSVDGTIRIVVVDEKSTSHTEYSVTTESGGTVPLGGDLPEEVSSGDTFVGTVAIPDAIVNAVDDRFADEVEQSADDPIDPLSPAGEQIVALADAPLSIVAGQFDVRVEAAAAPRGHTVNVAISAGTTFSDAEVAALLAGLNTFWRSESGGVITSVARVGAIVRNTTTACDYNTVWDDAARKFGRTQDSYWDNGRGEHLLVLTGATCVFGLGSIGNQVHSGGLIWATVDGDVDLHTFGHEFGHNLGLGHSNVHECTDAARVEGTSEQGCDDLEYKDYFDVMSGGFVFCSPCVTTNHLGALNATHKRTLGFFPAGSLRTVTTTSTAVLQPASSSGGLRALAVTDPLTGRVYVVEFRSGTGMDDGAFYSHEEVHGYGLRLGTGVRILTTRTDDGTPTSAAFSQTVAPGSTERLLTLATSQTFTTASKGLSITVTAQSSTATVAVSVAGPSSVTRIQGADRYATAVAIAKAGYTTAPVVYLATGANYPDALSAAPAAVRQGGPLLLTPSASLPAAVRAAIESLKPSKVVVVGGAGAVSPAVVSALATISGAPDVVRIQGADRYATARAVVEYAFGSAPSAYIATGSNYPDALSAAAAGGAVGAPVVLVDGRKTSIDAATRSLLTGLGVAKTVIAGGPGAVSAGIQSSLATIAPVSRVSGADRYATSQAINAAAFPAPSAVFLATGTQFPDALAGAALAGAKGAPLYVVRPTCIPAGIRSAIYNGGADTVTLLGGTGALNAAVMALRSC